MSVSMREIQESPIQSRARGWCFTINNFTEEEKNHVTAAILSAKYGIAETEHTDGDGTPHIQGYIYFDYQRSFNVVKDIIGQRAHLEPAKGNPQQNYDYCSKENTVFAMKDLPKKGLKPSFLEKLKDIDELSMDQFEDKYPEFFFYNFERIQKIKTRHQKRSAKDFSGDLKAKNYWLWGEPGVGKTRWAGLQVPPNEIYDKLDEKWWDNYDPDVHRLVLFDEITPQPPESQLPRLILRWADRKPFTAAVKGSVSLIEPRKYFFIITSNFKPEEIFTKEIQTRAIYRRFNVIEVKNGDLISQNITRINRSILELN